MNRMLVGLCAVAALSACSKKDEKAEKKSEAPAAVPAPAALPPAAPKPPLVKEIKGDVTEAEGIAAAKEGAKALGGMLKKRLMTAMQMSGPEDALSACADSAQSLTHSVANSRLRVGRSTLRLRNPKNAEAPEWVKTWLTTTGERKAEGVVGVEEVVDGTARVLMPLTAGSLCLACHGDSASHSEGMTQLLASRYPEDKAIGYQAGDLRGALWAEFDLKE